MKRIGAALVLSVILVACGGLAVPDGESGTTSAAVGVESKMDKLLGAAVYKGSGVSTPGVRQDASGAIDVLIDGDPSALPKLAALGIDVRTVTSSGIMTAHVPLTKVHAVAALTEVRRVEAAKAVRKLMDVSTGPTGLNLSNAGDPDRSGGTGVVVGVLDTGIDWKHGDFRKADGTTRVAALWDQSDRNNRNPPSRRGIGSVYTSTDIQACIDGVGGAYCVQTDANGHGSHVAGTAAGNGLATGNFKGIAPAADLVIVKFDFDGDRNTDANIVDGVKWIFDRAAAMGKPAVVNLSLGSDAGPHDGSTLQERGLDDLTGAGKIVAVAAGNPGRTGDESNDETLGLWGYPIHGKGTVPAEGSSEITIDVPAGATANDYYYFTAWYPGASKTQIEVETPSGLSLPSDLNALRPRTWVTGSQFAGYATAEGTILVGNGGDQLGWQDNNPDHELYVELSGALAAGTWKVRIHDRNKVAAGYHAWHGTSGGLTKAKPRYEGVLSDNAMTIGTPATGKKMLAIGAYASRMQWEYYDFNATSPADGRCTTGERCCQAYNEGALSYYDPFYLDTTPNGSFDRTTAPGSCDLATSEPYDGIAFFSARGPSRDGRVLPTIAAPGVGIIASLSADKIAAEGPTGYLRRSNRVHRDGKHNVLQGTSMACPHGTGAVALMLEKNKTITPANAAKLLADHARRDGQAVSAPDNDWGAGRIDMASTIPAICATDSECPGQVCCGGLCAASCGPVTVCKTSGQSCSDTSPCCSGLTCTGRKNKTCQ